MSFVKIWVHAVWSTKHRQPLLINGKLELMCQHIRTNAHEKSIFIDRVNGYDDHVHVLMLLNKEYSIAKHVQLLKGESAHWANSEHIFDEAFGWAVKYFAASVSGRKVPTVRAYIDRQQEHHKSTTFADEFKHFLTGSGFDADEASFE